MFSHIIKLKRQNPNNSQQRVQQDVFPSIKLNGGPFVSTNTTSKTPELTHKRTESKQITRRLKLKDYMRLNQISKQKRSRSAEYVRMESKIKLNKTQDLNLRTTFGSQVVACNTQTQPIKKKVKTYNEQAQLQRFQLMKNVQKIKQKFSRLLGLIAETSEHFTNYNDLVFMFRIEQMLNDYIKKGIHTITNAYKEHFIAQPNQKIDKEMIGMKLDGIFSTRNTQSPQKNAFKTELNMITSLNTIENEKFKNLSILPMSFSIKSLNKLYESDRSPHMLKKTSEEQ